MGRTGAGDVKSGAATQTTEVVVVLVVVYLYLVEEVLYEEGHAVVVPVTMHQDHLQHKTR